MYFPGYQRLWHSGGILTYHTQVWMYPEFKMGIFVTSNGPQDTQGSMGPVSIAHYISDLIFGEKPWANVSTVCSNLEQKLVRPYQTAPRDDPLPYDSTMYTGVYSNSVFGEITISYNATSDRLVFEMGRFLTTILKYNSVTGRYTSHFTGHYWYVKAGLDVDFEYSQNPQRLCSLAVPLNGVITDRTKWTVFQAIEPCCRRKKREYIAFAHPSRCDGSQFPFPNKLQFLAQTMISLLFLYVI